MYVSSCLTSPCAPTHQPTTANSILAWEHHGSPSPEPTHAGSAVQDASQLSLLAEPMSASAFHQRHSFRPHSLSFCISYLCILAWSAGGSLSLDVIPLRLWHFFFTCQIISLTADTSKFRSATLFSLWIPYPNSQRP